MAQAQIWQQQSHNSAFLLADPFIFPKSKTCVIFTK